MKSKANIYRRSSLRTFLGMIGCWLLATMLLSCASCQEIKPIHGQNIPSNPSYQNTVNLQDPLEASRVVLLPNFTTRTFTAVAAAVMIKCEVGQKPEALTAAHVPLEYWKKMGVKIPVILGNNTDSGTKNKMLMEVIKIDKKRDLALLRGLFVVKESCKTVLLARRAPVLGSRIFAIGAPLGYPKYITSGIVSLITNKSPKGVKTYRIDAAVEGGMSGGGLFNDAGELVGIVVARLQREMNLGFVRISYSITSHGIAVSLSEIKDFLGKK